MARLFGAVDLGLSVYEQSLYVKQVSIQAPDKVVPAIASGVVNISGDGAFTYAGAQAGAYVGALFVPIAYITVPVFSVIGGFVGHKFYDVSGTQGFVRKSYVGDIVNSK